MVPPPSPVSARSDFGSSRDALNSREQVRVWRTASATVVVPPSPPTVVVVVVVPPSVVLYWSSGNLVGHFGSERYPYLIDSVEEFTQRMEEGLLEDICIPRCQTEEDGTWLERYH